MEKSLNALSAMQRICSVRECCRSEILNKLKRYSLTLEEVDKIIKSLEEDKFFDHNRYAQSFVRDKSSLSGWGPAKIRWSLRSKAIEDEIIESAMSTITPLQREEKLNSILERKLPTLKKEDREKMRAKLIRFALSRGFEYEKVLSAVNRLLANFAAID
ncbi:MAG: hypothetical protein CVU10_04435 [Bacteroidetes bacterium HGW-Bacteroidetes-5]|jgi:regulatory protein|nr:MAG: hypothetical protein CVU10_04435 [Bacteroidetes bacterium HGW-Bacteroidetes-5]